MRKLSKEKRAAILTALVEGNSIASTCRMVGEERKLGGLLSDYLPATA